MLYFRDDRDQDSLLVTFRSGDHNMLAEPATMCFDKSCLLQRVCTNNTEVVEQFLSEGTQAGWRTNHGGIFTHIVLVYD
jgi:hypothetical protein